MESKLTEMAIGQLDVAYETVMNEYNTKKRFFVSTKSSDFMLWWVQ